MGELIRIEVSNSKSQNCFPLIKGKKVGTVGNHSQRGNGEFNVKRTTCGVYVRVCIVQL